jgi:hypothetical protein
MTVLKLGETMKLFATIAAAALTAAVLAAPASAQDKLAACIKKEQAKGISACIAKAKCNGVTSRKEQARMCN